MEELLKLQQEYIEQHQEELLIFPTYWFNFDETEKKIEVLKKAIQQKKLIIDVDGGSYFVEGIFYSKPN